ncbi:MAG: hypothetical protein HN403_06915 [Rhodospirillales bacterium]|jgi:hypothetical protein|nr:hypothetical protein [Rhodospirillales bacterium]
MVSRSTFEVAIVNREVSKAVSVGGHHPDLSDTWAEVNYFEVTATDESDARRKMTLRYPAAEGYVIEDVFQVKFAE